MLAVWQFGSPMIIFLAGLRQIPQDLYEAASMDGAGPVRQFFRITLPLLAPVIFFNLVFQTIEGFKAFTPAFIVSGGTGGPVDSTLFYSLYLYIEAFENFRMGYASALAWLLLVIIGIFTAIAFLTSRYWVYYEDEAPLDGDGRHERRARAAGARSSATRILMLAAFVMLYPLLWMIGSSFKPENLIFSEPSADPERLGLRQLRDGWHALRVSFTTFYANSFLIAGAGGDRQPHRLLAHRLRLRAARTSASNGSGSR